MNWSGLKAWVVARLGENSTRVALAGMIAAAIGHAVSPALASQIDGGVALACGVLISVLSENGSAH